MRDDDIDQIVMAHEAIVAAALKLALPAAWIERAAMTKEPDFLSVFDGTSSMLNTLSSKFGLKGMPPVDKASKTVPVKM